MPSHFHIYCEKLFFKGDMKERKETDRGTHGKQESLIPGQGHWAETKEASAYRGQEFIMIVSSGGIYFSPGVLS